MFETTIYIDLLYGCDKKIDQWKKAYLRYPVQWKEG